MTLRPLLLASSVLLGLTACSSSSPTSPRTTAARTTTAVTTTVASTTTTVSVSTTVAPTTTRQLTTTTVAATPIDVVAQGLLDRYDAAVAGILADPRVASDPANPKVAAYLALFPKDSTFAANTVKVWAGEGTKGRFYKPGPGGAIVKSTFRKLTAQAEDQVTFTVCTARSVEIVDANGNPIEAVGGVTDGEVVAVQVDGAWLLRDLTQLPTTECPRPGAS